MRVSYVLASVAALSLFPIGAHAQESARERRARERARERVERERERRDRERERLDRERAERDQRREQEREQERAERERVTVRVYRDDDPYRDRYRDRNRDRFRDRFAFRHGDRMPSRNLSLMVGVLNYDFTDDRLPMAALRADWRLTRFLRSEVDVTYALGDVPAAGVAPGSGRNTSLVTATAGVQAELPFRYLRPYVGVATGLFGRFDSGSDGTSSVRPTQAFPVGVRIPFSPRLALRAEARFRFDQHENNTTAYDVEQTAGLSFAF